MFITKANPRAHQSGFTLVEVLVGISLSTLVLAAVIAVYIPTVQTWRTTTSLAEIHDTEAGLYEILGNAIRKSASASMNCGGIRPTDGVNPNIARIGNVSGWAFPVDPANFLQTPFNAFAANINPDAIIGGLQALRFNDGVNPNRIGDVFFSIAPASGYFQVVSTGPGRVFTLVNPLADGIGIVNGSFYLVSNCNISMVVAATANSATQLNYVNALPFEGFENSIASRVAPSAFYIGPFQPNGVGPFIPTLFQRTVSINATGNAFVVTNFPVFTGVENMRLQFGIDDIAGNGGTFTTNYFTIGQIPAGFAITDARSVRVTLMLSDQTTTPVVRTTLNFPDLTGANSNCYGGAPNPDACPAFVVATPTQNRRVITYTFGIPPAGTVITP